ncbi:MAG: hypothetical protein JWO78_170 [Micavibrio sp.]|nr:hypothetical protein [Micavibrio sp.]
MQQDNDALTAAAGEVRKPIDNGGPAFPIPYIEGQQGLEWNYCGGLSVRDYMAGQALVGIMASDDLRKEAVRKDVTVKSIDVFAFNAYLIADAMLKARQS